MSWVSAAGPLANVAVAVALAVIYRVVAIGRLRACRWPVSSCSLAVYFNLALGALQPAADPAARRLQLGAAAPAAAPGDPAAALRSATGLIACCVLVLCQLHAPGGGPLGWLFDLAGLLAGILLGA